MKTVERIETDEWYRTAFARIGDESANEPCQPLHASRLATAKSTSLASGSALAAAVLRWFKPSTAQQRKAR